MFFTMNVAVIVSRAGDSSTLVYLGPCPMCYTRVFLVGPTFLGFGLRPRVPWQRLSRVAGQVGVQEDERECGRAEVCEDEAASFGFGD